MRTLRKRYYAIFWIQPVSMLQLGTKSIKMISLSPLFKQTPNNAKKWTGPIISLWKICYVKIWYKCFFLVSWNDGFINHCKVFNDTVFSYRGFVCHRVTGVESIWLTVVCCFVHSVAAAHKIGGPWLANFAWNQYKVSYKLGSQIRKPFLGCNAWEEMYSWWWEGGSWCHQ